MPDVEPCLKYWPMLQLLSIVALSIRSVLSLLVSCSMPAPLTLTCYMQAAAGEPPRESNVVQLAPDAHRMNSSSLQDSSRTSPTSSRRGAVSPEPSQHGAAASTRCVQEQLTVYLGCTGSSSLQASSHTSPTSSRRAAVSPEPSQHRAAANDQVRSGSLGACTECSTSQFSHQTCQVANARRQMPQALEQEPCIAVVLPSHLPRVLLCCAQGVYTASSRRPACWGKNTQATIPLTAARLS